MKTANAARNERESLIYSGFFFDGYLIVGLANEPSGLLFDSKERKKPEFVITI